MYWHQAKSTHLAQLVAQPRLGLITDMDGTVSPIVPVPDDAAPTDRNRELLQHLHQHLTLVAVVSGRGAADVQARVGLPELVYVGNHGLERWQDGQVQVTPEVTPYRPNLEAAAQQVEAQQPRGMWVEDKGATLSVHYRNTAQPEQTATDFKPIITAIANDHNLRVFQGRMIFELRPPIDVNKGTAFRQLVDEYQLDTALFIGDDTTDVDAMRMARQLREKDQCYSLSIGVESDDMPVAVGETADLLVEGVSGVEDLLAWLLKSASASST